MPSIINASSVDIHKKKQYGSYEDCALLDGRSVLAAHCTERSRNVRNELFCKSCQSPFRHDRETPPAKTVMRVNHPAILTETKREPASPEVVTKLLAHPSGLSDIPEEHWQLMVAKVRNLNGIQLRACELLRAKKTIDELRHHFKMDRERFSAFLAMIKKNVGVPHFLHIKKMRSRSDTRMAVLLEVLERSKN
jgi:biotin synthase-related radical SAM superfamily protein